jgi:hypothetical protein
MIFLGIVALLAMPLPDKEGQARSMCQLGRVVLADMPSKPDAGMYYFETDPTREGLVHECPQLARHLPQGYNPADDDARSRAAEHVPTPRPSRPPAVIYTLGVPVIAADGHSATVTITSECSGLCGGSAVYRYVRTPQGWRRDGKPRSLWVS